jgi:pSer/pThr/pTyr-binding forkhead associated (FHA) protein
MQTRLVALSIGPDIPVDHSVIMVGRHPRCDVRLDSLRVSRRHCFLSEEGGELVVRDLGSTNGTRINGRPVNSGRLKPGDELSIAHVRYRFERSQAYDATKGETPGGPEPG